MSGRMSTVGMDPLDDPLLEGRSTPDTIDRVVEGPKLAELRLGGGVIPQMEVIEKNLDQPLNMYVVNRDVSPELYVQAGPGVSYEELQDAVMNAYPENEE